MAESGPINVWQWAGFIVIVLVFLALDLGVVHRASRIIKPWEALLWCVTWFALAMLFALVLSMWLGAQQSLEFVTGYFVEFSLSLDNVVAIALIFTYFKVASRYQHRVLFWGILGALVMRGLMIAAGAALIMAFQWLLPVLGAFLVFTGAKWGFSRKESVNLEKNPALKLARKFLEISPHYDADKFRTWHKHRRVWTPLALVLVMVEATDLIFAVDSIPAIFAVTQKAFIVFTSNVFAILGLRSLYFAVAGALECFRFLKPGLAVVLIFIGLKMLTARWVSIPTALCLAVVMGVISASIWLSLRVARKEKRT